MAFENFAKMISIHLNVGKLTELEINSFSFFFFRFQFKLKTFLDVQKKALK